MLMEVASMQISKGKEQLYERDSLVRFRVVGPVGRL